MTSSLQPARHGWQLAEDTIKGGLRVAQTLNVLSRVGGGWLLGRRPPLPQLLRETVERLGTTYIKLGQLIASSPSLFPAAYVEEFQKCLDRTPSLAFHYIRDTVEAELGRTLDEIYDWVDPKPLASASIAQVHAARLKDGTDVVIKVQKPGVANILLTDFNFLYLASRIIETIAPGLSRSAVSGIIDELQSSMLQECDFLLEAKHMDEFNAFLKDTGNTTAVAPQPYHQYSSTRVLTMERFYGVPMTDINVLKRYTKDPAQTLINALNTWFSSLISCDFFHADVHAGNLMLLEDGRVGFIDFGIVGRVRRSTWSAMSGFLDAIGRNDHQEIAHCMAIIGMTRDTVDEDALARDLAGLGTRFNEVDPASLLQADKNDQDVNHLLRDLIRVGEQHGIRFPREFALLLKQFLYFDRYVQALAPHLNVFNDTRIDMWGGMEELPDLLH